MCKLSSTDKPSLALASKLQTAFTADCVIFKAQILQVNVTDAACYHLPQVSLTFPQIIWRNFRRISLYADFVSFASYG
jgi:hypothetical protein